MLNMADIRLILSLINQEIEEINNLAIDNKEDEKELILYLCDLQLLKSKIEIY